VTIPYHKILVPLDGSELAAQAIPHAEEIARGLGAKLILTQIIETIAGFMVAPLATGGGPSVGVMVKDDEGQSQALDAAREYLERVADSLRHRKIEVEVDLDTGDPATRIVDYADANAIDLIVMSTHGRTGVGRWTHGSVTNKVLQAAPCAVMVVRPTDSPG
jgi:nucleotide-binding universal stress UspA family protein